MIRVVIADDHHLVREGIRALLEKVEGMQVVGEAADGHDAVETVKRLEPDVLVMDIAMPGLNGIQALEQLRALGTATRVVILSMYSDEVLVRQALRHGVNGFLPKGSVSQELLLAIRAAERGAVYLSPSISNSVLRDDPQPGVPQAKRESQARLTPREWDLLQMIGLGHTNNQMAAAMGVSIKTVERHRTHLMNKLKARNLVELIRIAMKHGFLRVGD